MPTASSDRSIRMLVTRLRPRSVARMMVRIVALAMSAVKNGLMRLRPSLVRRHSLRHCTQRYESDPFRRDD
ncbi:hypothetical protein GCM10009753_39230 [Streptantibioticus ferralitis]